MKKQSRGIRLFALLLALLTFFSFSALPVSASPGEPLTVKTDNQKPDLVGGGLPSSALVDHRWIFSRTTRTITYRGGWTAGHIDSEGYYPFTYVNSSDQSWLMKNMADQWQSPGGTVGSSTYSVSPNYAGGLATGFGYEAPYAGTVKFALDSATFIPGDGFAVFCNGEMVFPTPGGAIGGTGDVSAFYILPEGATHQTVSAAMESASCVVKSGDQISFVVKRAEGSNGWHSFMPRVWYTAMAASMPSEADASSSLADSYPLFGTTAGGGSSLLAYRGRYTYAYAPHGSTDFRPLTTEARDGALFATDEETSAYVRITQGGAPVCGLAPSATEDLAVLYTVRYGGTVLLQMSATALGETARYGYTVYQNGTAVSPTVYGTPAELAAVCPSLRVQGGDTLAFVISRAEGSGDALLPPLGVIPSVTYQSITDAVAIMGAAMSPADSLDVHFYLVTDRALASADSIGIYLFSKKPADFAAARGDAIRLPLTDDRNGIYRYTYSGIAAKQMADTLYAVPYMTEGGTETLGAPYVFSVRGYAESLYGEDAARNALLTDMLYYGSAAQSYFGYRTEDMADARLSVAQRECRTSAGFLYRGDYAVGEENTRAPSASRIHAFSLLLESRISLRAYLSLGEGEENAVLQFSANGRFTDLVECPVENGMGTLPGIPAAGVGHVYHVRIRTEKDGKYLYSPAVSYSLKTYAANIRTEGGAAADATVPLADAMLLYGYSALAYANGKDAS